MFDGISTFEDYSMSKPSLLNISVQFNLSLVGKGIHTFPKVISPKVNLIARLDFERAYYDYAVQHISHYVTGSPVLLSAYF